MPIIIFLILFIEIVFSSSAYAADIAVIGDLRYKPIKTIIDSASAVLNKVDVDVVDLRIDLSPSDFNSALKQLTGKYRIVIICGSHEHLNEAIAVFDKDVNVIFTQFSISPGITRPKTFEITMYNSFYEPLYLLKKMIPQVSKVGVLYNPEQSMNMLKEVEEAGTGNGITIISKPAIGPGSALEGIQAMESNVDAFLIIPDSTAYSAQIIDYLLLAGFRNRFPVIGLSSRHVKNGALFAYAAELEGIGDQIGSTAISLLRGLPVPLKQSPKHVKLEVNMNTAKFFNISPKRLPEAATRFTP